MWTILCISNFVFICLGIRVNSQKVYSPVYNIACTRCTWWLPCNDPYIYHIDHFLTWWLFCTLHPSVLKYVTSAILHPRQENCNTPYWQGSIHSWAQITRSWKSHPSSGTECHWHFQQTGRCSLHFLTYDVTSLSHWLHRFTGASYWSDKIAPSSLIGRKAELQLCKNSISINCWNNVMVSMLRNIVTRLSSVWLWVFDLPGLGVGLLRQEGPK